MKKFAADGFTFKENSLGISVKSENNGRGKKHSFYQNDTLLFSIVYYNSWQYFTEDVNHDALLALDINCRNINGLLDSLYYLITPPDTLKNRRGRIFRHHYETLYKRLNDSGIYRIKVTEYLLEEIHKEILEDAIRLSGHEVGTLEHYKWINDNLPSKLSRRFKVCCLTGQYLLGGAFQKVNIRNTFYYITNGVSLADHGYIRHSDGNIWHTDDDVVFNRQVFPRSAGVCTCPSCGRDDVPVGAIDSFTTHCTICSSAAYKVHSYSTRVPNLLKFKAKKVTPNTLYLGCELEYETTDYDSARMKVGRALNGHAIMKSDGSISHGFEIVTCPATMDIQLEVFKKFFDNRPEELEAKANTGMHVHVSRKPLSVLTVGKLTEFMNREENRKFIEFIAGRKINHYCALSRGRTVTFPWTNQRGDRYNSLNLQNDATIEFRVFSSPLSYEDFAHKVQFCQALVDYAKPAQCGASLKLQTNHTTFMSWVMPRRKDYPELVAKLKGYN